MKRLVHITPTVPPSINGLGDFSTILASHLNLKDNNDNFFLITDGNIKENIIRKIVNFDAKNLYDKLVDLKPEIIILHYVGYAYDPKGLPWFLPRDLNRAISKTGSKLLIFFHELYSSSKNPLKLPFYTHYLQKIIVGKLFHLSSSVYTNCTVYETILGKLALNANRKVLRTGIFSNIPEDLYQETPQKDKNSLIVFGTLKNREGVYQNVEFKKLLQLLAIETVFDIGPGSVNVKFKHVNFISKGSLAPVEVATYLNKCTYGAINYPSFILGKSGIFSAYAAFGVIPVNFDTSNKSLYDDLIEGENYFDYNSNFSNLNLELTRCSVRKWYETRSCKEISKIIGQDIESVELFN